MDEIHSSNNHFLTLRNTDNGQADLSPFSQCVVTSAQAINMSISPPELTYPPGISFDGMKPDIDGTRHTNLIRIQSGSNLPLKGEMQVVTSDLLTSSGTNESCKIIEGQPSYIPVAPALNINSSPITLGNIESLGSSGNLVSSISTNSGEVQSIPVFESSSFENCDSVLRQNTGQTFILASPGPVLSSNAIHSPEELVYLPPSTTNQSYAMANSDTHFVSTIPVIQSSTTQPARIILQSNSANPSSLHQILTNNSSPLFLQMGNNTIPPTTIQNSSISMNNKGHIIIKSGSKKVKPEPETPAPEGVLKILVREGTTTKVTPRCHPTQLSNEDSLSKHVQINLPSKNSKLLHYDARTGQAGSSIIPQFQREGTTMHKLYSCPNCDAQFLKALSLRIHKRECKKLETKTEKIPSYMCGFCKAVFKGSSEVHSHFPDCTEHPSFGGKDKMKLGKNSQKKITYPILFKCQDCDRTFGKERQYTSHLKRCTEVNFNDLSGSKMEPGGEDNADGSVDNVEDPFADPPTLSSRRGRGHSGGRRGRPPGRHTVAARNSIKNNVLFEGANVSESTPGLVVVDNENVVRSTAGLAHTLNLSLDIAQSEGNPRPNVVITDSKGIKAKGKTPQAWSLICSLCQKMFVARENLSCHIVNQHGTELITARDILNGSNQQTNTLYRCPLCTLHFQSEDNILEHLVLRHTGRLQDCYSDLQAQTGTFVCSLCSIVLLTKKLLIEHLSLEHLDELVNWSNKAKANERRLKERAAPAMMVDNEDSWDGDIDNATTVSTNTCTIPINEDNPKECCFCLEYLADEHTLHQHYISCHQMETDKEGCIIDNGIDVDIRVKDTQSLLLMAGTKMEEGTPDKTVFIQKKPKKSFLAICHTCHKNFNRQDLYYRHIQEGCIPSTSDGRKALSSAEKNFFCKFKECSHLVFNQVKSLFKHMYDSHRITVPKERKTFRNLHNFQQWLDTHSKERSVRFVRENSKVEKGSVSFSQMVCEKFHSSRANKAKEKEAELSKPTKKRLSVRTERSEDCYSRIHLRTEYNTSTGFFDGETQMIYYPQHSHLKEDFQDAECNQEHNAKRKRNGAVGEEDGSMISLELDQEFLHKRLKPVITSSAYDHDEMSFSTPIESSNFDLSTSAPVTSSNVLMVQNGPKNSKDTFIVSPSDASAILNTNTLSAQNPVILQSNALPRNAVLVQSGNTVLVHNSDISSQGIQSADTNRSLLLNNEENSNFIVQDDIMMNMNEQVQSAVASEYTDEFVLPADEQEWSKLFTLLRGRLVSNGLTDDEKKDGESLLPYEEVVMAMNVQDQFSIFQRLCAFTDNV